MRTRLLAPAVALLVTGALLPASAATAMPAEPQTAGSTAVAPASDTGPGAVNPMIVGGTTSATARGVVSITSRTNEKFICTGTLIAPGWVLTARHCVDHNVSSSVYRVRAKSRNRMRGGIVRHGYYRIEHPNVDLALIRLQEPIHDAELMKLATENPQIGAVNKIKGWGRTDRGGDGPPAVRLKSARVEVRHFDAGQPDDGRNRRIWSEEVTGYACQGDSGGPQMRLDNGRQNGVIAKAACWDVPGVPETGAISVPAHLRWIRSYVSGV